MRQSNGEPHRIITASEVGQYAFCARAWWLGRIQGRESINVRKIAHGVQAHASHGGLVSRSDWMHRLALYLLILAGLIGVILLLQLGVV